MRTVLKCRLGLALGVAIPCLLRAATVYYSYDAVNRLTQVAYLDNTTITYDYDAVGNWTTNRVLVAVDADNDGIPDWWMNQYFGHATGQASDQSRAGDDADRDGMSNLQEYLAGTNPRSAASGLRLLLPTLQGADFLLSLPTVTNRLYVVEWTTDLGTAWLSLPDIISGNGAVQQVRHVGGATLPRRFYRVRLL